MAAQSILNCSGGDSSQLDASNDLSVPAYRTLMWANVCESEATPDNGNPDTKPVN